MCKLLARKAYVHSTLRSKLLHEKYTARREGWLPTGTQSISLKSSRVLKMPCTYRKAQVFYLDLFIAILIIVAASIFFFQSEANIVEEAPQRVNNLFMDADSIADSLMSPGVPKNWNKHSVIAIGLVDDFRINITKLYNFQGMVQDDYPSVRQKLQTPYDFFISFADKDGIIKINNTQGIGKPGVNSTNVHEIENPADLIVINRLVIYNSNPVRMVLYVWN